VPTFDGYDDFAWVCGPSEGLWHLVCLVQKAVDGGLQIDDRSKDAVFQPLDGSKNLARKARS